MEERLQKILAQAGFGSRRTCEELIAAGRVTVDGRVVTEQGTKVDPQAAEVRVDGRPAASQRFRYVMLHKPVGYLSHLDERAGYPSWQELVKTPERLFAVGRLDADSEGLLLLTNDGELANLLIHPRYEHPKTYLVQVEGYPNPRKIRRWQHGVMLDDGPTAPAEVEMFRESPLGERESGSGSGRGRGQGRRGVTRWLKITIHEGRKRQLRRMVGLLGHPALRVIRIALGPLTLGDLRPGKWRDLTPGEVKALQALVQADKTPRQVEDSGKKKAEPLMPSTIAIDGPAASGKSTVGGRLAAELGYLYFDTGVMYRAITAVALARGVPIKDEDAVTVLAEQVVLEVKSPTVADGRDVTVLADGADITCDLRKPEVERAVSPVSAYAGVRYAMVAQQRRIGQGGKVVMVGRDIGTVVMPGADLKVYLDASLAERAQRRTLERTARGEPADPDKVLAEMKRRDQIDSDREHSPLSAAPDAIMVDSTHLTIDDVLQQVQGLIRRWGEQRRR
ncbi:MAG: (d)CMP kinase [Chloroflexi bacterium]|nr:(d)CMP kinase [Chloroflexota bacterium]